MAAEALRERGVSVSARAIAGYERGENEPAIYKQRAILRAYGNIAEPEPVDFPENVVTEPPEVRSADASEHPPGTFYVIRKTDGFIRFRFEVVIEQVGEPEYGDGLPVSEEAADS